MNKVSQIACLFGGQGTQYIGMGKEFYDLDEDCRQIFKIASQVMNYDMAELCFYGEEEQFTKTTFSLPSMLTIDLCAYILGIKQGFSFTALAGFSLGEYATLAAAEVVSTAEAFEIVKILIESSESVLQQGSYGMMAVNASSETCQHICDRIEKGEVAIANYTSKKQMSLAGDIEGLNAFKDIANEFEIKTIPIHVNRPFHNRLMKPAADILEKQLEHFKFLDPKLPIYMNVDGKKVDQGDKIKSNIIKQLYSPVKWTQTLENMFTANIDTYVECGLKSVLSRTVRDTINIDRKNTIFLSANVITS
ncbi:ACP S-malonyltransferase [Paenibacillus nicotianae]|uniref:Malonyl CoA-acyl carrier protein transacylase n=1 Tax=Paenibacillus nicotianae TaxID=1526551 RepID=A0ABW4UTR1_9BACL